MRKTYGIQQVECSLVFNIGKAHTRINFIDGGYDGNKMVKARYTTDDPIKQFAIENDSRFKEGIISVVKEWEEDIVSETTEKESKSKNKAKTDKSKLIKEDSVTNYTEAKEFLSDKCDFSDSISPQLLMKVATEAGYEFPNYKID